MDLQFYSSGDQAEGLCKIIVLGAICPLNVSVTAFAYNGQTEIPIDILNLTSAISLPLPEATLSGDDACNTITWRIYLQSNGLDAAIVEPYDDMFDNWSRGTEIKVSVLDMSDFSARLTYPQTLNLYF